MAPDVSAANRIRVLVVDDNFYIRLGTVTVLRGHPEIDVVADADDAERARALFQQVHPDVVVIGTRLPSESVQLATTLCARSPDARILMFTHHCGDEHIFRALEAGARGYLSKGSTGDDLLAAIRTVYAGRRFLPEALASRLAQRCGLQRLTPRECQVLEQIAEGASNRETAHKLGISERTVGLYVSNILSKLGAAAVPKLPP